MSDGLIPILGMVGVAVLVIFVSRFFRFDKRLARWWAARVHRLGKLTGLLSFLLSSAAMLCHSILLAVGMMWTEQLGHWVWALCLMLPQSLVYAPFMLLTMPTQNGYGEWRDDLQKAGVSTKQQRQIAWWGGPPSLVGMAAAIGIWLPIFLP